MAIGNFLFCLGKAYLRQDNNCIPYMSFQNFYNCQKKEEEEGVWLPRTSFFYDVKQTSVCIRLGSYSTHINKKRIAGREDS